MILGKRFSLKIFGEGVKNGVRLCSRDVRKTITSVHNFSLRVKAEEGGGVGMAQRREHSLPTNVTRV